MTAPDTQRILKANATRELGTRVAFNFEDLQQKGENYLAEVRAEATKILNSARLQSEAECRQLHKTAVDAGHKEGLREAAESIEKQIQQQVEQQLADRLKTITPAVQQAAVQLKEERDRWVNRWETQAIELSVAIAGKLIRRELAQRPEIAQSMLAEALQLAAGESRIQIRLNPRDLERMGMNPIEQIIALSGCAEAITIPDPQLAEGDCILETKHGSIDARLETLLNRITDELLDEG